MKINPYLCAQIKLINNIIYPFLKLYKYEKTVFNFVCCAV